MAGQCASAGVDRLGWNSIVAHGSFLVNFVSLFNCYYFNLYVFQSPSAGAFSHIFNFWPSVICMLQDGSKY